jgi:hypothetical protein
MNYRDFKGMVFFLVVLVLFLSASPSAATAAEGTETVCITCHGSLSGRYGEPVQLWQGSIHAENGITCHGCHGGDPKDAANAMSPARGFLGAPKEVAIPAFCGRCHVGVERDYRASAHGRALGRGGPTCVTCHGNHRVVKASLELISEKNCGRCHDFQRARQIRGAMEETEGRIAALEGKVASFRDKGFDTEPAAKELFALRNRFRSLFHNVDVELVKGEAVRIQAGLRGIDTTLLGLDATERKRKLTGAVAVGGALLAALLFHLLKRTYD